MTDLAYTDPSVLEGIRAGASWADPVMNPEEINWAARQARAAIPFKVVNGRPVNPCERTAVRWGRNCFGHWGEALMADAIVIVRYRGRRHLLMIERQDGHGWAVPGGHVDEIKGRIETGTEAALRELEEETGLSVFPGRAQPLAPRYVPDPRASDEAWAVTIPVRMDLGVVHELPFVQGADDAAHAAWVEAGTYEALTAGLAGPCGGGKVFAAHVPMLTEFLGSGRPVAEEEP